MKRILQFTASAILLFAFSSCEKCIVDCDLVPAKIIRYDCDRVIFQIMDGSAAGDADWEDVQTGRHYNNVVSYSNTCKIASLTNGQMVTLYVSIKKSGTQPKTTDCYQCQAVSANPPQTMVDFGDIATEPCEKNPFR